MFMISLATASIPHLQRGPGRVDEERHEEDQREDGGHGQQDEEGRRVEEQQIQSGPEVYLFLVKLNEDNIIRPAQLFPPLPLGLLQVLLRQRGHLPLLLPLCREVCLGDQLGDGLLMSQADFHQKGPKI